MRVVWGRGDGGGGWARARVSRDARAQRARHPPAPRRRLCRDAPVRDLERAALDVHAEQRARDALWEGLGAVLDELQHHEAVEAAGCGRGRRERVRSSGHTHGGRRWCSRVCVGALGTVCASPLRVSSPHGRDAAARGRSRRHGGRALGRRVGLLCVRRHSNSCSAEGTHRWPDTTAVREEPRAKRLRARLVPASERHQQQAVSARGAPALSRFGSGPGGSPGAAADLKQRSRSHAHSPPPKGGRQRGA
jgi:hypothetical protein